MNLRNPFKIITRNTTKLDANDNFPRVLPCKPPREITIQDGNERRTRETRGLIALSTKGGGWEFYDKYHGYRWSNKQQAFIPFDIK
jgi:hypothetical protein